MGRAGDWRKYDHMVKKQKTHTKSFFLTHDREPSDGPVPAGVVRFRRRVVVEVAVLKHGEDVVGAVEAGAVVAGVALVTVVAAGTLEHPPPVVVPAPVFFADGPRGEPVGRTSR